jgi:hypothetical protein
MAKQTINVGTTANDRTGDPLRTAFTKVNSNFTEVYNNIEATDITVANNNITVNDRIDNLDIPRDVADLTDDQGLIANIPRDIADLTDNQELIANIPADVSDLTDTQGLLNPTVLTHIELTDSAFIIQPITRAESIIFTRLANVPNTDFIDTNLSLSRGSMDGLYNTDLEQQYDDSNNLSPLGTQWNLDGWDDLSDIRTREYDSLYDVLNGAIDESILNQELIMHDTINDKYYTFYFTNWGQGGSFAYTRRLIQDPNVFVKEDYATGNSTIDTFVLEGEYGGVGITRDNNGGIYNPYREEGWDQNVSPDGIGWNLDGWDDLSNIQTRTFIPFYQAFGGDQLDNIVPGTKAVIHIPDYAKYYAIQWLSWTQNGNGGGFSYLRYEINENQINEGVKFSDGTILKTAAGLGNIKSRASGGRIIEEVSGHTTATVGAVTTTNLSTFASRNAVDTSQIYISTANTTIDDILNDTGSYGIIDNSTIQFSIDNSTWYTWSGGGGYPGDPERSYDLNGNPSLTYNEGDTIYFRYKTGGAPAIWWDKNNLPSGGNNFRGAIIDYHGYTGQGTWIGTMHIVDDSGEEHITHTEVSSGSTDMENDDLWLVQNEGTISYRRIDGEAKTLKIHWTAKVFYGTEYYND